MLNDNFELTPFVPEITQAGKTYAVEVLTGWMRHNAPKEVLIERAATVATIEHLLGWMMANAPEQLGLMLALEREAQEDLPMTNAEIARSDALIYFIEKAFEARDKAPA